MLGFLLWALAIPVQPTVEQALCSLSDPSFTLFFQTELRQGERTNSVSNTEALKQEG